MEYFDRLWTGLGDVRPERFELRRDFLLGQLAPGGRVLDVGCGDGAFCAALAAAGHRPVGVDVAAEAVRRAGERHPALEFALSGESALPFAEGCFEAAWLGEVIEHLRDGLGLLDEVGRVLVPGGRLIASVPDHPALLRLRLGVSRRAFEAHFEPRADHLRFFTRGSLRALLEAAGFEAFTARARAGHLLVSARAAR